MMEAKIHRLAKFKKLDALDFYYSPSGKPVVRRPAGFPPNAVAVEDIPAGATVIIDAKDGIAEIRVKRNS